MKKIFLFWAGLLISLCISSNLYAQLNIAFGSQINYTQAVSDIWGYTDPAGNEYALVCTQTGLAIANVTNPALATELHFIAGSNNTWRDVHTWSHYAYMVTESSSSGGLLIIDLAGLPSTITTYYTDLGIGYYAAHTLYVDDATGTGYLFGAKSTIQGNATFFINIAANPTNPTYLGKYTTAYVHDGYVRNDTMWSCEIYAGRFAVVDVSDKTAPVVLATQTTPYAFTHAAWLSDNSHYLFTTDEKNGAPITVYDVSDIYDIKEIARYRTKPLSDSLTIAHNDYVRGDFLVSSYYTAGITIADITYPYNIVEVGNYDTSFFTGAGFNGCWGVYPYFASGTILATDRQEGLFVLTPTYTHACWLEGVVHNILNNAPLPNAEVHIIGIEAGFDRSDFYGFYATGTAIANTYQVVASATGFYNDTLSVALNNGVLSNLDFSLIPNTYCSTMPSGLIDVAYTDSSAIIAWQPSADAQQYVLQYRAIDSDTWQSSGMVSDTSFAIGGLIPCTAYQFRLQSRCNYNLSSPFTPIETFVTTAPNPEWLATSTLSCGSSLDLNTRVIGYAGGTWSGGDYINSNGLFDPSNLAAGDYAVTYTVEAGNCTVSETHDITVVPCFLTAHLHVILGGAYQVAAGNMRNNLSSGGLIPLSQPYNTTPWYYNGTETLAAMPADAVDWVLIELRSATDIGHIETRAAAILLQDGRLLNTNGTSGVQFLTTDTAAYYLVVRHRNHLAVVSQTAVPLPNTAETAYDFATIGAAMGGNQTYFVANGGVYALRPGDMNGNGVITVDDFNSYLSQISQINVYQSSDITLDASVTVADFNQYLPQSSFIGLSVVRY